MGSELSHTEECVLIFLSEEGVIKDGGIIRVEQVTNLLYWLQLYEGPDPRAASREEFPRSPLRTPHPTSGPRAGPSDPRTV